MKKYKLGELLDVKRGASVSGEYFSTEGNLIRLTLGNFDYQSNGFKENTSKDNIYYIEDVADEFILDKDDIITPLTEQAIGLLGSTAKIPESGKYIQTQDTALVKVNADLLNHDFAYYLLPTPIVKKQLSAGAQQTSIRHTSPDKIKDCIVYIPELDDQEKIASFLDDIDRKISLNRKANEVLESMAKQLYDYWFVQFDFPNAEGKPYKSSGGKMVYNETLKREIPEGWEVLRVDSVARIFTGKKDVSKITPGDYKFFSCAPEPLTSDEFIYDGELILVSGNGSYTGRVSYYNGKCDLYQRTYGLSLKDEYKDFMPFFYPVMKYMFEPYTSGGKHGSSIPYIVLEDLAGFNFVYDKGTVCRLIKHIKPLFSQRYNMVMQNESLTSLRDYLLPLLMNGQVKVL